MFEKIDPTWLAYALEAPSDPATLDAALGRVRGHYDALADYPTRAQTSFDPRRGVAVIGDAEPRCRWPHFAEEPGLAMVTAYVPTGWRRLVGPLAPEVAPLPLARTLSRRPDAAAQQLAAPFVIAILDRAAERLVVVNDCIGAGRLFELRLEGATIWSNRAAAPLLFAGVEPRADQRGWRLLAAASWPIGNATPLRGVRRVEPGTVIAADASGVDRRVTDAVGPLVRTSGADVRELVADACDEAVAQVAAAGLIWPGRADVALSGGRDSRIVAAAVLVAGIEARFETSDELPGEADVARQLVEVAPRPIEHEVRNADGGGVRPHTQPLLERALNVHLLHDGMRHPQKMRLRQTLPRARPETATLSGHGGDVAHGYFYKNRKELRRLRRGGSDALVERVMRLFVKDHRAARDESYAAARAEVERILAEGRRHGVEGPVLLEWFYLVDRFANRSGVGAHAERVSVFGTSTFVRAAFALTPEERIESLLHRLMVARLVPAWADVPFFKADRARMRRVRRLRIWEASGDASAIERLIGEDGPWVELYEPDRVRAAWEEVRAGGGKANWEPIFEGVAYRCAFDDYLALLGEHTRVGPPLVA